LQSVNGFTLIWHSRIDLLFKIPDFGSTTNSKFDASSPSGFAKKNLIKEKILSNDFHHHEHI
jgi:hypothetical protein